MGAARKFGVGALVLATALVASPAAAQLALPSAVPADLEASVAAPLASERAALVTRHGGLVTSATAHNQRCSHVGASNATLVQDCAAAQSTLMSGVNAYLAALEEYESRLRRALETERYVRQMLSLAQRLGWTPDEQARLANALRGLAFHELELVMDVGRVRQLWSDMRRRGDDANFVAAAAAGRGPVLFSAGLQSGQDCAVYALAAASRVPYRAVAERAEAIIRDGEWRSATQSADPAATLRDGLIGGEVVMLAEMFGQAEIVTPAGFADSLRQGRPVIVTVAVPIRSSATLREALAPHAVVLSRTFRHGEEDWFEVIDSSRASQQQRLFVSASELTSMLTENGVALRPDGDVGAPGASDTG